MLSSTKSTSLVLFILVINYNVIIEAQLLEGIYCGRQNCYDILRLTRTATKSEISKSYRQLAKLYHPDLRREKEAKKEAEEQFKELANAYEILRDDESRADYDYMLDNPDEYYAHYYRYYRRRVGPKVDVKYVIFITIAVISLVQYFTGWQKYDSAIAYFSTIPKYRNKALDLAREEGLLSDKSNGKKSYKKVKKPKDIEQIIKKIIEERMDIQGACAKPKIVDLICIQLLILPYTVFNYIYWYTSWIWRHNIQNKEYTEEEKLYIVRKYLKLGEHQFSSEQDELKPEIFQKELWIRENFDKWQAQKEELTKKQLAENNRYKQYRRYLKTHGVSRLTFDDS